MFARTNGASPPGATSGATSSPAGAGAARRALLGLGLGLGLGTAGGLCRAAATENAWNRPALKLRRPEQTVLMSAALAGRRIVAVGERGVVLLSDDAGRQWRQAEAVPASVSLTTVRFVDGQRGYAVGHAGTVLGTRDGGQSWVRLLEGPAMARLVLNAAQAGADTNALADAQRLAAGMPDRPLLDLALFGTEGVLVIGAYGVALYSGDAGATWESRGARIPNPKGLHLYALRSTGRSIMVAGEQGTLYRSDDAGASFRRVSVPYAGSFFTLELPSEREILLAGLRGNAWRSTDGGTNWSQIKVPVAANITASARRADGSFVLASQAGLLLAGRGDEFKPLSLPPMPPLTGVLPLDGGALLVLSMQGPLLVPPPSTS